MTKVGRDTKADWALGDTGLFWFSLMTPWWPCWTFLRLHGGVQYSFLSFLWKAQICYVVWWLSKAPWLPSYFLFSKIPSPCLISPCCLLLRRLELGLTHLGTGTREMYLWEIRIELIKVLLASRSSDSILHFAFKSKTWNIKQGPKNLLSWFWNLPSVHRIHFILEMCCHSTPHHVICVWHSR